MTDMSTAPISACKHCGERIRMIFPADRLPRDPQNWVHVNEKDLATAFDCYRTYAEPIIALTSTSLQSEPTPCEHEWEGDTCLRCTFKMCELFPVPPGTAAPENK